MCSRIIGNCPTIRDGKPISVTRMTVSADGKALTFASHDLLAGTTSKFAAMKQ